MSVLSDTTIENYCVMFQLITPFDKVNLQPASYDLTLGELPLPGPELEGLGHTRIYMLAPKEFILASTKETVDIPSHMVARIEGKSTNARKGLIIHTAGFVDPGFKGQLTLEISNLSDKVVPLELGMLIAQIAFQFLDRPAAIPYGHPSRNSHYQNQQGITGPV